MRKTYKTPQGGPTEIVAEMPDCAGRNGAPTKLYWKGTEGGMGGAHDVLMANDDKYVGHFYVDADDSVDVQAVLRLIAAAPDLLEALRDLAREAARNIYPKPDVGPEHPYSILRRAEAAIAKAEGRP